MTPNLPIREFAYVNKDRLEDFLSPLLGGMPYEHRETSDEQSARLDAQAGAQVAGIKRTGGQTTLSWEELRRATPASLFELLYQALMEQEAIQELGAFDDSIWQQVRPGEFVLSQCHVQLSALERLFNLVSQFAKMMSAVSPEDVEQPDVQQVLQYLSILTEGQESVNVRATPIGAPSEGHIFVASLDKSHMRVNASELEGEFQVLGRVRQKLARDETFEVFSLVPGVQFPRDELSELIEKFSEMPAMLGPAPTMEDLQVTYPAIVLTPVALFR